MALVLDKAVVDDAPAIGRIFALGFSDPFNSLRYGSMTLDDKITLFTKNVLKYLEDEKAQWSVMRDNDASGKVVAFAGWGFPQNEQEGNGNEEGEINDEQQLQRRKSLEERIRNDFSPFTEKVNVPLIAESLEMWARLKGRTLKGRPAFVCKAIATDPDYRRRGAARALVQIPFQQADNEGHLIYLDTFEGGYQEDMYRKFGFEEQLKDGVPDMERFDKSVPSGFTSFIRFPKSE